MTEEYMEKHYGEWLSQMAEDPGFVLVCPPTDEDMEEMHSKSATTEDGRV